MKAISWKSYALTVCMAVVTGIAIGCSKKDSGSSGGNNDRRGIDSCSGTNCEGGGAGGYETKYRLYGRLDVSTGVDNEKYEQMLRDYYWCEDASSNNWFDSDDCEPWDEWPIMFIDFAETKMDNDGNPSTVYLRPVHETGWVASEAEFPVNGDITFIEGDFVKANQDQEIAMWGNGPFNTPAFLKQVEVTVHVVPDQFDNIKENERVEVEVRYDGELIGTAQLARQ